MSGTSPPLGFSYFRQSPLQGFVTQQFHPISDFTSRKNRFDMIIFRINGKASVTSSKFIAFKDNNLVRHKVVPNLIYHVIISITRVISIRCQ